MIINAYVAVYALTWFAVFILFGYNVLYGPLKGRIRPGRAILLALVASLVWPLTLLYGVSLYFDHNDKLIPPIT